MVQKREFERYKDLFKERKMTPQRHVVLEVLLENNERHLSAEELYELSKNKDANIGLATIYRTIELLQELNIVQQLHFGDGRSRYELCHLKSHQHHHLVCLRCNRIFEVKADLLSQLEDLIECEHDFVIEDHRVQFFGYCKDCVNKHKK